MNSIKDELQAMAKKLSHGGATAYQIAQLIAAETDPTNVQFKATERRWQRWLKGESLSTLDTLEKDLNLLGFSIKIVETR